MKSRTNIRHAFQTVHKWVSSICRMSWLLHVRQLTVVFKKQLYCPAFLIAISVWSNVYKPENNVGIMLGLCGVRVTRSLVLYVCFVDRCLPFCTFSFGHCVVCSSIYGFWLPYWYPQTLLRLTAELNSYKLGDNSWTRKGPGNVYKCNMCNLYRH
jgi:hypothetical protein